MRFALLVVSIVLVAPHAHAQQVVPPDKPQPSCSRGEYFGKSMSKPFTAGSAASLWNVGVVQENKESFENVKNSHWAEQVVLWPLWAALRADLTAVYLLTIPCALGLDLAIAVLMVPFELPDNARYLETCPPEEQPQPAEPPTMAMRAAALAAVGAGK